MKRAGAAGVVLIAAFVMTGGSAWAGSAVKLCVPKAEEREVLTPKHGKCKRGYKLTSLGAEGKEGKEGKTGAEGRPGPEGKAGPQGKTGSEGKAGTTGFTSGELETLKGVLPCIKSVANGIDGKPTVQFSGCNVQIVNGEGKTASTNGEGNLVIGYDEEPFEQTGSHNLILGKEQEFTSYGGIIAGVDNTITAPFTSVSGGLGNKASGFSSSVSGGQDNTASGERSSVSGGEFNTASGFFSSVSGGDTNTASGRFASVSGGETNAASGERSSVSGGASNKASGSDSSVQGGGSSEAAGTVTSVGGGEDNKVGSEAIGSWIGGGFVNSITGGANQAAIFGGEKLTTSTNRAAIP